MEEKQVWEKICTCNDLKCPNHPSNHDQGCTLCIQKNLACDEVPTCIFKNIDPNYAGPGYKTADFAELVMSKKA